MDLDKFNLLWQKYAPWYVRMLKGSVSMGMLLTLIYFVKIRTMPIDSFQSLAGLAPAVVLVSLGVFLTTSFYWELPGFLFRLWVDGADAAVTPWLLTKPIRKPDSETLVRSASVAKVFVWCMAAVCTPWVLFIGYAEPKFFESLGAIRYIQVPLLILSAVVLGAYVLQSPRLDLIPTLQMGPHPPASKLRGMGIRLLVCATFIFANAFPLLIFFQLLLTSDFAQDSLQWHVMTLLLTALAFAVTVSALAIALVVQRDQNVLRRHVVQPIIVVVMVILGVTSLGIWGQLLDRVMIAVSLRVPNAVLLVSKSSCQALEMVGLKPRASSHAASAAERGCVIRDVTILARIGARWPLGCKPGTHAVGNLLIKGDDVPVVFSENKQPLAVQELTDEVHLCVANAPTEPGKSAP